MLTGPQRKFCDGIVVGLNGTNAYAAAYPRSNRKTARNHAAVLRKRPEIQAEIARLRARAETLAGSAVMTLVEKRLKLARIARSKPEEASFANEDCEVVMTRNGPAVVFPSKLAALKLDNDLAGEGSVATANDALAGLLERVMR